MKTVNTFEVQENQEFAEILQTASIMAETIIAPVISLCIVLIQQTILHFQVPQRQSKSQRGSEPL